MKNLITSERLMRPCTKTLLLAACLLWVLAVPILPAHAQDKRVFQTELYGNVQYQKPGTKVLATGERQPHK